MRLLLLFVALLSQTAWAQKVVPVGSSSRASANDCAIGTAEGVLDAGDVRAALYNIGNLFWRGEVGRESRYEVPRGTDLSPMFSSGLWVGGTVGSELRFAGSTYGPWEYWPGPLDADGQTTPETCAAYDRIWTVGVGDIDTYEKTGAAAPDLEDWPVGVGAPFYTDANGNRRQDDSEPTVSLDIGDAGYGTRVLDLEGGERPVVFGRQSAWWIMNDRGGPHEWSNATPLGIEVRAMAWTTGFGTSLSQSTFYRYQIINRSSDTVEGTRAGLFVDADLGEFYDDYTHSDSTRQMLVFYNGGETDNGRNGYGTPPPAFGVDVLSGSPSAMNPLKSAPNGSGEPENGLEAFRNLQGLWADGMPIREGGDGYDSNGPITTWTFPGDPTTGAFWSQENVDGNGTRTIPSDKRGVISAEPLDLAPGERYTVDVALLFARGPSRLGSVTALRAVSDSAQVAYESGRLFSPIQGGAPRPPVSAPALLSPADGASFDGPVLLEWAPVVNATAYEIDIDTLRTFETSTTYRRRGTELDLPGGLSSNVAAPYYWRVRGVGDGQTGPYSEIRSFTNAYYDLSFESFEVIANAAGPLTPATGGSGDFGGFPVPERPGSGQQIADAIWLLSAGGIDPATTPRNVFDAFVSTVSGNGARARRIGSSDFEIRFTGTSLAAKNGFFDQTGDAVEIPFEIWDIGRGTPTDASDDYRMIPVIRDLDGDGTYNLSTSDSPISGAANDPETDWISWYDPSDTTPGQAGYLAYENGGMVNAAAIGLEVMSQTTFVGWNLGTTPPYAAPHPETGTIFRLVTTRPFNVSSETDATTPTLTFEVFPNPSSTRAEVAFALEDAGPVQLTVLDMLGREVALLEDGPATSGEHRADLEVERLAPGVYVVVLETAAARASRTITVVR